MSPCPGQAPVQLHLCTRISPIFKPEHSISMKMSWLPPLVLAALVLVSDSSVMVQWWSPLEAQHDWRPVEHWRVQDTRKLPAERRSLDGAAAVIKEQQSRHVSIRHADTMGTRPRGALIKCRTVS